MAQFNSSALRKAFAKKTIITVDSKDFLSLIMDAEGNRLTGEFRPVCVREGRPLADWMFDASEADRIAGEHRREFRHGTTVQMR